MLTMHKPMKMLNPRAPAAAATISLGSAITFLATSTMRSSMRIRKCSIVTRWHAGANSSTSVGSAYAWWSADASYESFRRLACTLGKSWTSPQSSRRSGRPMPPVSYSASRQDSRRSMLSWTSRSSVPSSSQTTNRKLARQSMKQHMRPSKLSSKQYHNLSRLRHTIKRIN